MVHCEHLGGKRIGLSIDGFIPQAIARTEQQPQGFAAHGMAEPWKRSRPDGSLPRSDIRSGSKQKQYVLPKRYRKNDYKPFIFIELKYQQTEFARTSLESVQVGIVKLLC